MKWVISVVILSLMWGCSKVKTINLEVHDFGTKPTRIIWFQVAGFAEEHLALLRFNLANESNKMSLEKMSCNGKMWNYNLEEIRPVPEIAFLTQLTGKKNIKQNCDDFALRPVWAYLSEMGYVTGIFEAGIDASSSLLKGRDCVNNQFFNEDVTFWSMNKATGKQDKFFHYHDKESFEEGRVYYDQSCQQGACYSSISSNVMSIYKRFAAQNSKLLFIVRDFSYYNALKEQKVLEASEILFELEKTLSFFMQEIDRDTLVLWTSSAALNIEFPAKGKKWEGLIKKGQNLVFHQSALMSPVFAKGPSAENFCGIYSEAELIKRLFWTPRRSIFRQKFMELFGE